MWARGLDWLWRPADNREVAGSSPAGPTIMVGVLVFVLVAPRRFKRLAELFNFKFVSAESGVELLSALRLALSFKPKTIFVARGLVEEIEDGYRRFKFENPIPLIIEVDLPEDLTAILLREKHDLVGY